MSTRGGCVVTTLYCDTGFENASPGCITVGSMTTLNTFPPTRSPYVTDLPPPETTPLSTDRLAAGTPSCCAASVTTARRAWLAAPRIWRPAVEIPPLATVDP